MADPGEEKPGGDRVELVETAWGEVPGLVSVHFPRPLAEPTVGLSPQQALHGSCRQVWLCTTQGLGILFAR